MLNFGLEGTVEEEAVEEEEEEEEGRGTPAVAAVAVEDGCVE